MFINGEEDFLFPFSTSSCNTFSKSKVTQNTFYLKLCKQLGQDIYTSYISILTESKSSNKNQYLGSSLMNLAGNISDNEFVLMNDNHLSVVNLIEEANNE